MTTPVPPGSEISQVSVPVAGPVSGAGTPAPPAQPNEVDTGSQVSFMDLSVGDEYDGATIEFIHGVSDTFIVYEVRGQVAFDVKPGVRHRQEVEAAGDDVMATAEVELKGAYRANLRRLFGAALVQAFSVDAVTDIERAFEGVRSFIRANAPIGRVFGRSRDFVVFQDRFGHVQWECGKLLNAMLPVVAEFERLNAIAANSLNDGQGVALRQILGHELAIAFRSGDEVLPAAEAFSVSRDFIGSHLGASVSNRYVMTNVVVATIFGIAISLAIAFPPVGLARNARALCIGAIAGVVGAFISVLQRSSTLTVTNFASHAQIISQAMVRMILGSLFGVLIVIAVYANLAFGTFKAQPYALFLAAVAAGFSERLIPDLLEGLSKMATETKRKSEGD